MTRFMMSLDDAVDLVLYAFEHGNNGDIFIQKAPAATIETLAKALTELLKVQDHQIQTISDLETPVADATGRVGN